MILVRVTTANAAGWRWALLLACARADESTDSTGGCKACALVGLKPDHAQFAVGLSGVGGTA